MPPPTSKPADRTATNTLVLGGVGAGNRTRMLDNAFVPISDSSPGVDPTVQESLFKPFVTMKPREQGRGLGLFVVRQLLTKRALSVIGNRAEVLISSA